MIITDEDLVIDLDSLIGVLDSLISKESEVRTYDNLVKKILEYNRTNPPLGKYLKNYLRYDAFTTNKSIIDKVQQLKQLKEDDND